MNPVLDGLNTVLAGAGVLLVLGSLIGGGIALWSEYKPQLRQIWAMALMFAGALSRARAEARAVRMKSGRASPLRAGPGRRGRRHA